MILVFFLASFAYSSFLVDDSRIHLGLSIEGGLAVNFRGVYSMPGVALYSIYDANSTDEGRIYMDPASPFATTMASFMILFQERSLVVRPTSPENLCYLSQISYTQSLYPDRYSIFARISLLDLETETVLLQNNISESSMEFTIDFSSSFDVVPDIILDELQDAVSASQPIGFVRSYRHAGFGLVPTTRSFRFVCGSEDILDQLPIVQYTIMSSSDPSEPLTFVRLFPRDYLGVDLSGSVCKSKIRSIPDDTQPGAIFGMPFISTVALHLDISNGVRIGLGEPI